jgi:hypothetical protein
MAGTLVRRQPPILNILVEQTGHVPWVAFFPFFIVMACGSFISLFALQRTQYAVTDPIIFTNGELHEV